MTYGMHIPASPHFLNYYSSLRFRVASLSRLRAPYNPPSRRVFGSASNRSTSGLKLSVY